MYNNPFLYALFNNKKKQPIIYCKFKNRKDLINYTMEIYNELKSEKDVEYILNEYGEILYINEN